jgi:uncharacterized protein (DUF1778 family)
MVSSDRWAFRVAPEADRLVREAAQATQRTLTDFVVEAATVEAERVLGDRTRFVLDAESWRRFSELLEQPTEPKAGLDKLFAKPPVFE